LLVSPHCGLELGAVDLLPPESELELPRDEVLAVAFDVLEVLVAAAEDALDRLWGGAHEEGGQSADEDEGEDPAEDDDTELAAVDGPSAVEEADKHRRADLLAGSKSGVKKAKSTKKNKKTPKTQKTRKLKKSQKKKEKKSKKEGDCKANSVIAAAS
jgi:hypothetical protein